MTDYAVSLQLIALFRATIFYGFIMKKAIFMCYILGGLFLILPNLFAQDNFESCFENERTKAHKPPQSQHYGMIYESIQ